MSTRTMLKLLYAVRPGRGVDARAFRRTLLDETAPALLDLGVERLKLSVTEPDPVRVPLMPMRPEPWALLSVWNPPPGTVQRVTAHAIGRGSRVEAWQVTESVPRGYERDWQDGESSPGAALVTLFRRKGTMPHARFLAEWHGRHTPLALEIHPLWNYVRNVVDAPLVDRSSPWDGIVEEHFRERADVTDPRRFYGGAMRMIPNMLRVGLHARSFLDLGTIENHLVTEIHLRS